MTQRPRVNTIIFGRLAGSGHRLGRCCEHEQKALHPLESFKELALSASAQQLESARGAVFPRRWVRPMNEREAV